MVAKVPAGRAVGLCAGGPPARSTGGDRTTAPHRGDEMTTAAPSADSLFMIGLAGIGIALIAGIGIRIAATSGVLLLIMMWSAVLPPANNVFMDDHLIYALLLTGLALTAAGDTLGLGHWWS